jgi:hypothetical protein
MSVTKKYKIDRYIGELLESELPFLPSGIIEKSHTGMGATHMELTSKRNSIIVEPIKITAYTKVSHYNEQSESNVQKALYVGSAIGSQDESTEDSSIQSYVSNKSIKHKKIVCVADSLKRVVEFLIQANKLKDYFLLIDEIDSIQNDSSFRKTLENCLDIYFMFEADKRAVLTASMLDFTNAKLNEEPRTQFLLKTDKRIPIEVYSQSNSDKTLIKLILDKYSQQDGTVVVVLNSLKLLETVIVTLLKYGVESSEISVLCSKDSEARFSGYYNDLENKEYPGRICFITSAYFTGYDIVHTYHLLIYTSVNHPNTLFSGGQIKQISGRLRSKEHLSISLIRRIFLSPEELNRNSSLLKLSNLTTKDLLESSEAMLQTMQCLSHNLNHYRDELDVLNIFRNGALNALSVNNASIIRQALTLEGQKLEFKQYVRSDFFIDSKKEQIRIIKDLYSIESSERFELELSSNGFEIVHKQLFSDIEMEKISETVEQRLNKEFLLVLKSLESIDEYELYFWLKSKQLIPTTNQVKVILKLMLRMLKFYSPQEIISTVLEKMYDSKKERMRNKTALDSMALYISFQTSGKDFTLRILLKHYFQEGVTYNRKQIFEIMKIISSKSGLDIIKNSTKEKDVMRVANQLVYFKRTRVKNRELLKFLTIVQLEEVRSNSIFCKMNDNMLFSKKVYSIEELLNLNSKVTRENQYLLMNEEVQLLDDPDYVDHMLDENRFNGVDAELYFGDDYAEDADPNKSYDLTQFSINDDFE